MRISAQTIAQLAALSETFDDPAVDLLGSLTTFAEQVRLAVPCFLGVSVTLTGPEEKFRFQAMENDADRVSICSSLMIPGAAVLGGGIGAATGAWNLTLIVYASVPGSLVDLAADLTWLTGLPLSDFAVDQHLSGPGPDSGGDGSASVINQALGALLERGLTPAQAQRRIEVEAAEFGGSRLVAAEAILAEMITSDHPSGFE